MLEARVGAAGASDRIVVAGTATFADGATLAITPIGYVADGSTYTLLSAGTLTAAASNQLFARPNSPCAAIRKRRP